MEIEYQTPVREWDEFVSAWPDGHVLQTSAWGAHQSDFGWQVERVALRREGRIVAGAQVLFRRLPPGWYRAYIPKGPLVDFADADTVRALFVALHGLCRARRTIFLKIEPDLTELTWAEPGFRPSSPIQPRRTVLVDLTGSEDQIFQRMKSKTRYNIHLAQRKGVSICEGSRDDMAVFNRMMATTGARDHFRIRSDAHYERAYDRVVRSGMGCLFVARYQDQPIAAIMAFACGNKSWYMYGASADDHREKMPNYLLQWAAIRWARTRGCTVYDLWGVPDEEESTLEAHFTERGDGLWGVYRFKRGFGGRLVRYVGAFDYVYNRPMIWLYHLSVKAMSVREYLLLHLGFGLPGLKRG